MKFLTAHWQHLLLANYRVEPEVLQPLVPEGTTLDTFEGEVYLSLVAFLFNRTRILGLPIPYHVCFEEVNLRFYVSPDQDRSRRAVTFIKEIVPRAAIPLIANHLFNENYVAWPMSHRNEAGFHCYTWDTGRTHRISARINSGLAYPRAGSLTEFITEHYWGYARGPRGTLEYQVEHPQWQACEIEDYQIEVDFEETYGPEFAFLNTQTPVNVLYAAGSEVSVSFPRRLRRESPFPGTSPELLSEPPAPGAG